MGLLFEDGRKKMGIREFLEVVKPKECVIGVEEEAIKEYMGRVMRQRREQTLDNMI